MSWGVCRRIGWKVWMGWVVTVLVASPLCAQPMPWPSDLEEQPKAAAPAEEKPPAPPAALEGPPAKPASTPAGPAASEPVAPASKEIRELKPSLYYLKDKQGNLQPVPGFTLEEFRELYELKHLLEQKAQPPSYTVQSLDIQGEVRGQQAELTIEVRVSVRETPVRIPLRLEGMVIRKFEGVQDSPARAASASPESDSSKTKLPSSPSESASANPAGAAAQPNPPSQKGNPSALEAKPASPLPKSPLPEGKPSSPEPSSVEAKPSSLEGRASSIETKPSSGEAKPEGPPSKVPSPASKPESEAADASGGAGVPASPEGNPQPPQATYLLHWEEGGEGYVVWILGAPETSHRIRLYGAAPIQQVGQQSRLRFRCVRAPVSQMKLQLPGQGWKVEASDPAVLLGLEPMAEAATQLKLEGFGGNVELVWWRQGNPSAEPAWLFEVTGETVVRLEGQKISTQANLFIKVLGPPCQEVSLRLPEGAKLRPPSQPGCTYSMEKPDRIKLYFLEKALEHRVQLEWEQVLGSQKGEDWVEIGGWEVLGAVKHRGYLAVWGPGQGHLLWRASPSLRQTEQLPASLLGEGLLAGFEYTSQPFWLQVRLISQQVRVSLEPEYRLWISGREVRLEGLLKYTIRGAKLQGFRVEMPGWELEELGPEELVGQWALPGDSPVVEIPLKQPMGGHLELKVVARRAIPAGSKQLVVPLPQGWQVQWPMGGVVTLLPASVIVIPDENVELAPDEKQMSGWVRQLGANLSGLPKRQQPILVYRAESGVGSFVAGFRVHERAVRVEGVGQVRLEEEGVQVEQRLSYTIAYEAINVLNVWVPSAIRGDGLEVLVDGQAAAPVPVAGSADKAPEEVGPVQLAVPLLQPRIGPCDLTIRYRLSWEKLPANQPQLRTIPLVTPGEGQWQGWRMTVTAPEGWQVKVRSANWNPGETLPEPNRKESRWLFGCTQPASELLLEVSRRLADHTASLRISRAFIQTWWTRSGREDRAVYRFREARGEFVLRLPPGANGAEAAVWVNGQPSHFQLQPDGRLQVPLPAAQTEWVVEVRYHFQQVAPPRGLLEVAFPQPEPAVWIDRCYWVCHLPRDEHLLINPQGFVPEYQWGWNGWSWGRMPRWNVEDLEAWAGASPTGLTPGGFNTYLFSTIGRLETASLYTTGRSVLVFTASLAALGIGLLVIYVPAVRHPAWILAAGVGLGAVALLWPEQTVLALQAALLGVLLAVFAALLQQRISLRQRGTVPILGVGFDQESTQRQYLPPPPGSTGSTQLMPPAAASNLSADIAS